MLSIHKILRTRLRDSRLRSRTFSPSWRWRGRTLDGDDIGDAFKRLAEAVHPLALGNVKRSINQIRQLAKKLISVHPPEHSEEELSNLVTRLTTQFYSHQHLISRTEALEMDLPIVTPDDVVEQLLLDYHAELKTDLDLMQQFDPAHIWKVSQPQGGPGQPGVPGQPAAAVASAVTVTLERAYVETTSTCDAFVTRGTISQQMMQGVQMLPTGQQVSIPQTAIALEIDSERWEQLA